MTNANHMQAYYVSTLGHNAKEIAQNAHAVYYSVTDPSITFKGEDDSWLPYEGLEMIERRTGDVYGLNNNEGNWAFITNINW